MKISPPFSSLARLRPDHGPGELWLRYAAATAATLIAIAGAQLVIANNFAWMLAAVTVAGVPISLYLRFTNMHVVGLRIPRPLWNALTVVAALAASFYYVFWSLRPLIFAALAGTNVSQAFWLHFSAGDSVSLLMQSFLIFAAFRSFAMVSDKDATLATVPSFSVLLLLIPVHKGLEVVVYFVLWTGVSAILFALDHRAESRSSVVAYVPSMSPGQEAKLSARGLVSILGFSLAASVAFSYFVSSRDPSERTSAETAVTSLATRITQFALSIPDVSVNAGPERQIDFSSGPTVPSRSLLWRAQVETRNGLRNGQEFLHPSYWRMFTLTNYDGDTWTQTSGHNHEIRRSELQRDGSPWANRHHRHQFTEEEREGNYSIRGYSLQAAFPGLQNDFGRPETRVVVHLQAMKPSLGYIPQIPVTRALLIRGSQMSEIRGRGDGAIDLGVINPGQEVYSAATIPEAPEYGGIGPNKGLEPNPEAVLDPELRRECLELPQSLPVRVRQFARGALSAARPGESAYLRAQRLALAVQDGAVYTLRPPTLPPGRDAVDYFLNEGHKRGYCTYFAGALTVLCRAAGIPARVVSGFASDEWEAGGSIVQLREANAHAWTEIWVDNFGWKLVDATPAGDRGDNSPTWLESWADFFTSRGSDLWLWVQARLIVVCLGLVALLSAFLVVGRLWSGGWFARPGWGFLDVLRRQQAPDEVVRLAVVRAYERGARSASRTFRPRAPWETPEEWRGALERSGKLSAPQALKVLTQLYEEARYQVTPLDPGAMQHAEMALKQLLNAPRGKTPSPEPA